MLNQEEEKEVRVANLFNALLGPVILAVFIGLLAVSLLSQGVDQYVEGVNEVNFLAQISGSTLYERLSEQYNDQQILLAVFLISFAGAGVIGLKFLFKDEYETAVRNNDFESAIKNASLMFLLPPSLPLALGFVFLLLKSKAFGVFAVFVIISLVGILWNYVDYHKVYSTLLDMAKGNRGKSENVSKEQTKSKKTSTTNKKKKK